MSYQKVIMVGNLTKDGELKYSQGGSAIYSNSIAVSKKFTSNGEKKEKVMYIDVTAFAKTAEICNQYLRKGSKVLLDGEIEFQQWVDQNGGKRSKHSFNISTMQMLDSKGDNQGGGNAPAQGGQPAYQQPQQQSYQAPTGSNSPVEHQQVPAIDIDEDEIPF